MIRGEANIHSLPVEILGHVLNWLDDDDLRSAASVSRHWFDTINHHLLHRQHAAIMRPEAIDFKPHWPLESLSLIGFDDRELKNLHDVCNQVKHLHISSEKPTDHIIDETNLDALLGNCESLTSLSFKNIVPHDSTLHVIMRHGLNTLQSLSFECRSNHQAKEKQIEDFHNIYFPEVKLIFRPINKPDETHLYARYPIRYNCPPLLQVPKKTTTLTIDCNAMTKDSYHCLRYCTKLRSLVLINAFRLEDDAVALLSQLPELRTIYLSDAMRVTSEGWTQLFSKSNASSISLVRCTAGLSDSVFHDIKATDLTLDLQTCKRVTEEGLISMLCSSERLSLTLDYAEEMLEHLINNIDLIRPSCLRQLNITIQRVHATSFINTSHIIKISNVLDSYCNQRQIRLSLQDSFTKVEHNHRPIYLT